MAGNAEGRLRRLEAERDAAEDGREERLAQLGSHPRAGFTRRRLEEIAESGPDPDGGADRVVTEAEWEALLQGLERSRADIERWVEHGH